MPTFHTPLPDPLSGPVCRFLRQAIGMDVPIDGSLRTRRLHLHRHGADRVLWLFLQDSEEVQAGPISPVQWQALRTHAEHHLGLPRDGLYNTRGGGIMPISEDEVASPQRKR